MSIGCISRSSLKEAFRGLILHVWPKKSDRSELYSFGTTHTIGVYIIRFWYFLASALCCSTCLKCEALLQGCS